MKAPNFFIKYFHMEDYKINRKLVIDLYLNIFMQQIRGTHLLEQQCAYVISEQGLGTIQLVDEEPLQVRGKICRKIHYNVSAKQYKQDQEVFTDLQFKSDNDDLCLQFGNDEIQYERLVNLYQRKHRPRFFPKEKTHIYEVSNPNNHPTFLNQINLFSIQHYRSMFITQDYSEHGRYEVIVNNEGRFELEVVDDLIPININSGLPILNLDIRQPWLLILVKVWAKRNGGYNRLKNGKCFEFISAFTNSNWKYYNLSKQTRFLGHFENVSEGRIILKTKNTSQVERVGLYPGEAFYELTKILRGEKQFVVMVTSPINNKWTGSMSMMDQDIINLNNLQLSKLAIEKDMLINRKDFYNIFSSAFVTSSRKHSYSNYYILNVQKNNKKALYLQFRAQKNGFLDFSIKQFSGNKRKPNFGSKRGHVQNQREEKDVIVGEDDVERYQKLKLALIYNKDKTESEFSNEDNEEVGIQLKRLKRKRETFQEDFRRIKYECIEIDYEKGYNSGDARFINIERGWYILRLKPESSQKRTQYVFNYTSNNIIKVKQIVPEEKQRRVMLHHSILSISEYARWSCLDTKQQYQKISFADEFESAGYSFISILLKKKATYALLLDVNPSQLHQCGYELKSKYKELKQGFGIVVNPGEGLALLMKRIRGFGKYNWPPMGVKIFRKLL